jgi:hypothetical protein
MPVKWTPEGERWKQRQRGAVRPLEEYVEGPPPEARAAPLREEPVPIIAATRPFQLVPTIEHLKIDTVETTQLLVEFDSQRAWVVPTPRYTLMFEEPKWTEIGTYPVGDPEKVKQYHDSLKWEHQDWEIERRAERRWTRLGESREINVFYGRPPARKSVHRSDPYLMAQEVLALKPKRLAIQYIPRAIAPPPGTRPSALPWRLRLTTAPSYFHEHE